MLSQDDVWHSEQVSRNAIFVAVWISVSWRIEVAKGEKRTRRAFGLQGRASLLARKVDLTACGTLQEDLLGRRRTASITSALEPILSRSSLVATLGSNTVRVNDWAIKFVASGTKRTFSSCAPSVGLSASGARVRSSADRRRREGVLVVMSN